MLNNYTEVIIQNILLLTNNDSLMNELRLVLPKGHRLVYEGEMTGPAGGWPIVIIDIDWSNACSTAIPHRAKAD